MINVPRPLESPIHLTPSELNSLQSDKRFKQSPAWTKEAKPETPAVQWTKPSEIQIRNPKVQLKPAPGTPQQIPSLDKTAPAFGYIEYRCRCKKRSWLQIPVPLLKMLLKQAQDGYVPKIPEGMPLYTVRLIKDKIPRMEKKKP